MADVRVDFTDGRIFSNNRLTGTDLDVWKLLKLEFPWSWSKFQKVESDEELGEEPSKTLFFIFCLVLCFV